MARHVGPEVCAGTRQLSSARLPSAVYMSQFVLDLGAAASIWAGCSPCTPSTIASNCRACQKVCRTWGLPAGEAGISPCTPSAIALGCHAC